MSVYLITVPMDKVDFGYVYLGILTLQHTDMARALWVGGHLEAIIMKTETRTVVLSCERRRAFGPVQYRHN